MMLVNAVVIAKNRTGTDITSFTDPRIANVGKVIDLGASRNLSGFDLGFHAACAELAI